MQSLLGVVLCALLSFSASGEESLTPVQRKFLEAPRAERWRIMGDAGARAELAKGTVKEVGGVFNFRDLGGKRGLGGRLVRHRLLYRSARFDEVTDEGRRKRIVPVLTQRRGSWYDEKSVIGTHKGQG